MNLRFEPMRLDDVVEDAVRLMRNRAETAGLARGRSTCRPLPEVEADYRALKQVLLNLLSNAVKFTPHGGAHHGAAAERRRDAAGRAGADQRAATPASASPPDDLARLARPFEQIESQHSKTQQGTGLGLALTKSLVEMHGGVLEIASEPGEGTTVSFTLPVRHPASADVAAA